MKKLLFFILFSSSIIYSFTQEHRETEKASKDEAVLLSLHTGIWMPTGKLMDVGSHPAAGLRMDIPALKST